MRRVIIAAIALISVVGCAKSDGGGTITPSSSEVRFTSVSIDTNVTEDGAMWNPGDEIGVSMLSFSGGDILEPYFNYKHVSTNIEDAESVTFETKGDKMLYPSDCDKVKFLAYYPYVSNIENNTYLVEVSDQSENIDFMFASCEVLPSDFSKGVNLKFSHMLSKITLSIEGCESVTSLDGLEVEVSGLYTEGAFNLGDGVADYYADNTSPIKFNNKEYATGTEIDNADKQVDKVVASAIVLPELPEKAVMVTFTLSGCKFTLSLPADTEFEPGNNYLYKIKLGNDEPDFSGSTIIPWDASSILVE